MIQKRGFRISVRVLDVISLRISDDFKQVNSRLVASVGEEVSSRACSCAIQMKGSRRILKLNRKKNMNLAGN
jgi:hypothetical protein